MSERRLSLIANSLPVLIAYIDSEEIYRFANNEYTSWFGLDPSEIVGKRVKDVLGKAAYEQVRDNVKKVLSGQFVAHEGTLPLSEGGKRHFLARYIPHQSRESDTAVFFALVEDISEHKRNEKALKEARAELEQRVEECTAELTETNEELQQQIEERKHAEEALRKSEKNLRSLYSELLTAQEKERARIARELHDGIGQSLGTIKVRVETLHELARSVEGRIDPQNLSDIVPLIQKTMEEVRNTSMDLRPSTLDTLGILATITWFCREFQITYSSIHVETELDISESVIPDSLMTVLYRILQEALNNIAKHSRADHVSISLSAGDGDVSLIVEDNGDGFDLSGVEDSKKGLGLHNMRERTELSGGRFVIESRKGQGTRIRGSWPLQ